MSQETQRPRIDLWLLAKRFVLLLIVPVAIGLTIDFIFDIVPIVTIIVIVIFFPLAAYVLSRTSLRELDRVIAEITPEETETAITEIAIEEDDERRPEPPVVRAD